MAVHIRLTRAGTTKVPFYRIVAADQRAARGGRFIERIGSWDPRRSELTVDRARARYWIDNGALPTATVARLFKNGQVLAPEAATDAAAPKAG